MRLTFAVLYNNMSRIVCSNALASVLCVLFVIEYVVKLKKNGGIYQGIFTNKLTFIAYWYIMEYGYRKVFFLRFIIYLISFNQEA